MNDATIKESISYQNEIASYKTKVHWINGERLEIKYFLGIMPDHIKEQDERHKTIEMVSIPAPFPK